MSANKRAQQGFSLIELIAGIVIFAVAVSAMTGVLFPHARKSVDPVYQVRAAELGQSLLNEILGKAFDEQTDYTTGRRCGEGGTSCTLAGALGPDVAEAGVNDFDDVDDYDGYTQQQAQLDNGVNYNTLYRNFSFTVSVAYDGDYNGVNDNLTMAKRVDIAITTPGGETFQFSGYKGNF